MIETVFEDLGYNQVLEQCAPQRVGDDLLRTLNTKEMTDKPDIVKVYLRRFDQTLPDIGMKGRQLKNYITRFEQGGPFPRRGMGYSGIRAQRTEVDKLSDPPCA